MNILFLSYDYPNRYRASFEFVKNLVEEFAKQGHNCYVIAPYNVTREKRLWHGLEVIHKPGGGSITVARPNTMTFSNIKIGKVMLTNTARKLAINHALKKMKFKPDVAYGHFWCCGAELYPYAIKHNIPLFVASGESTIDMSLIEVDNVRSFSEYVSGVICVSGKNRDESIGLGLTSYNKCEVFPNAVNTNLFFKRNRNECRKKLNFPHDAVIAAFVGWFDERKGALRVAEALSRIDGIKCLFIGKGSLEPNCDGIVFKGFIKHDDVPEYLNAADFFVLPTKHEGCCNAVIEAMACGLPIISSNLPFNWDVLDDSNSIMIDPNDIDEIESAILKLKNDVQLRYKLADGAIRKANGLTIEKRATNILRFIEKRIGTNKQ